MGRSRVGTSGQRCVHPAVSPSFGLLFACPCSDVLLITTTLAAMRRRVQVKKRHAADPRYAAVNSSSLREQLFEKHLASLASSSGPHSSRTHPVASTSSSTSSAKPAQAPSKEDKAARAAASLREREEKVRLEKMRNARSAERARGHLGKDEAEREFAQLLVDAVRDHNVSLASLSLVALVEEVFPAPASATSTYAPL